MAGSRGITIKPLAALAERMRRASTDLYQAPGDRISGVDSQGYYSPGQPVAPVAPEGTQPKGFQFYPGQNFNYTPRPDAEHSADDLKRFAKNPLVRVLIENVKDVVCNTPWEIHAKKTPGEKKKDHVSRESEDPNIAMLTAFFECPDGENMWPDWVRPLIEDMLVIDAASVLLRKQGDGKLVQLRVLPGESITRYIDDNGYTPMAPDPAYAQNWFGLPLVNLTTDQLVYKPRNIVRGTTVASQMYGCSPVQQAAEWIEIAQLRLEFQKSYYTEGSIPGVVHVVPPDVTPDKIAETMAWMNSELAGNTARKQQWRMIQGFSEEGKDQILFPKEKLLTDSFDELLIRCLCFAFGVSPQRLMKMMNRASSEASQDAANIEGFLPYLNWLQDSVVNFIIQRKMGLTDYEMVFLPSRDADPIKNAELQSSLVKGGIRTINEGREAIGDDSFDDPIADELGIITATGFVPLGESSTPADPSKGKEDVPDDEGGDEGGDNHDGPTLGGSDGRAKKKALKSVTLPPISNSTAIDTAKLTPRNRKTAQKMHSRIEKWMEKSAKAVGKAIRAKYGKDGLVKADDGDGEQPDLQPELLLGGVELDPIHRDSFRALILLAWAQIDWTALSEASEELLADAGDEGAGASVSHLAALLPLAADQKAAMVAAETAAQEYSQVRSDSMIGMKRVDGKLVNNPAAKYPLTTVVREDLARTIAQALQESWSASQLAAVIEGAHGFSTKRAELIAETEIRDAQAEGTFGAWLAAQDVRRQKTGVAHTVITVRWRTSGNERVCDKCDGFEAQGVVPLGHEFAPGIKRPLAHPHCDCALEMVGM